MANYGGYAPYAPLAAERSRHVDDLLRVYPTAKAVNQERSVWDVALELKDRKANALRVSLTPHFPQEAPVLNVLIPITHPAVDSLGRVRTAAVTNWVYGSSQLTAAVNEALAVLGAKVADSSRPAGGGVPYPPGYPVPPGAAAGVGPLAANRPTPPGGGGSPVSGSPRLNGVGGGSFAGPATTTKLPDFSRLPTSQLEELLQDEDKFKEVLREAVAGSGTAAALDDIQTKNRQLAQSNISRQDTINEVRNQLAVVRSSEYSLISARFESLLKRQNAVTASLAPHVWREKLENAVSEADAASSTVASGFLSKAIPLDQFVLEYVELRAKHHILDLKRQAAEQLLQPA